MSKDTTEGNRYVVPKKPAEEEMRKTRGFSKNRMLWAVLLARTFGLKMETCQDCGGHMRIVAAVTDPASVKTYLDGLGLKSEIPKLKPPRSPPQMELDMDYGVFGGRLWGTLHYKFQFPPPEGRGG